MGRSFSASKGEVIELDGSIAAGLIRGKLAEQTDEDTDQEIIHTATPASEDYVEELLAKQPKKAKRKPAVKKQPQKAKK